MKTQKNIAIIMLLTSSTLTAMVCGDIAYPAVLCMLGLLGLQRRFTWDIRPEKRVITSLLLLLLAIVFSLHYRYAGSAGGVAYVQAAAVAWQTIARYFLASMILIFFNLLNANDISWRIVGESSTTRILSSCMEPLLCKKVYESLNRMVFPPEL